MPIATTWASPTAAYVHIPFCRRRCFYCDFPVSVVGDRATGDTSGTIQRYIEVLCREIYHWRATEDSTPQPLATIFFGGGTPSLLSPAQIDRLITTLTEQFGLLTTAEISMEMDPGTFDQSRLQAYKTAGINRVSLGIQAFQADLLQLCGRTHTVADAYAAVDMLYGVGIDNLSLDLISGLPHQTLGQWQESLEIAIALKPKHLSCYDLIVEPKTAFSRRYHAGVDPLPSDDTAADMYRLAQQLLTEAGYHHYEISNYAQPGYDCRHNQTYWANRPYYGFGMGAASYVQGERLTRPRTIQGYATWTDNLGCNQSVTKPQTSAIEEFLDTVMLGLRTANGLSMHDLTAAFGLNVVTQLWTCLAPYHQQGLVVVTTDDCLAQGLGHGSGISAKTMLENDFSSRIRLSDPDGFLLSNTILADVFAVFDDD